MERMSRGGMVGFLCVATILALAAAAWACTPSPQVQLSRVYGPAGTDLTVIGSIFPPEPVEIRWGSESGAVLGEGKGPDFSTVVAVPAGASPGLHYLYYRIAGDQSRQSANSQGEAFAVFEVTPGAEGRSAGVRAVAADLWSGFSEGSVGPAPDSVPEGSRFGSSGPALPVGLALFSSGFFAILFAVIVTARRHTLSGKDGAAGVR